MEHYFELLPHEIMSIILNNVEDEDIINLSKTYDNFRDINRCKDFWIQRANKKFGFGKNIFDYYYNPMFSSYSTYLFLAVKYRTICLCDCIKT